MNDDDLPMTDWLRMPDEDQWAVVLSYLYPSQRDRRIYPRCLNGHPLSPMHSRMRPNGARICLICKHAREQGLNE